jgi:2-iminobutanoate/2-iminopropanoate deaminase
MIRTMRLFLPIAFLAAASVALSADKKVIQPKEFAPGKPFSPGILVDGTLYVAGQTGSDLKTGKIPADFEAEVKTALDNIGIILHEAKMDYQDVVAVQVYLTDMDLFPKMNGVYTTYFKDPRPARTTVGVMKLVGTSKIEITVTAHK